VGEKSVQDGHPLRRGIGAGTANGTLARHRRRRQPMIVHDRTAATDWFAGRPDADAEDGISQGQGRPDGQPDQVADVGLVGKGGRPRRRRPRRVASALVVVVVVVTTTRSLLPASSGASGHVGISGATSATDSGGTSSSSGQAAAEDDEGQGRAEGGVLPRGPGQVAGLVRDDGRRGRSRGRGACLLPPLLLLLGGTSAAAAATSGSTRCCDRHEDR